MSTPEPAEYPATVEAVAGWLGATGNTAELTHIAVVVTAVNALVRRLGHTGNDLADDVVQGAVMLAGRITRRRNSPAGVESFGDLGPTYVARYDPDIEVLLGLGRHRPMVIG